jgi:tetratricopeptide (TPR) repeat protein
LHYSREITLAQGNYAEAIQRGEQALSIYPEGSGQRGSFVLRGLQRATWSQGDYEYSARLGRKLLEEVHEFPGFKRIFPRIWLGRVALSQDNLSQAEDQLNQALSEIEVIFKSLEYVDLLNMIDFLQPFIVLFRKQEKMQPAARLLGATNEVFKNIHLGLSPRECSEHDEAETAVRTALGDDAFFAAWEAGRELSPKQAIQELLANPE